jgi:transposase
MIQRTVAVVIRMLANVQQATIGSLVRATIAPGSVVYRRVRHLPPTGGVGLRASQRLPCGRRVRLGEDGDGFCEVHLNTMEGFWSLLRSWLRPHRGISQEKLPLYLGFFEFVHNVRRRGKALLGALIGLLVKPPLRNTG